MTALDDMTRVLEVACLTADRSNEEQDAMLRVAARLDQQANALTVTNRRQGWAQRSYRLVAETREDEPSRVNAKTLAKLDEQADRWNTERMR